ncbi:unnamed protein product, partial [Choristocarpus tenellus]
RTSTQLLWKAQPPFLLKTDRNVGSHSRPEDDNGFDADEAALLKEMIDLPKNIGVRKVTEKI